MSACRDCGREVLPIEISLTKKLINRASEVYLCRDCLKRYFSVSDGELDAMIKRFREEGCSLFL